MQRQDERTAPLSAYAGIFLCSVGVLMLQVLLTRVFSYTIWYHLAYLTISTALLGFGAAGSLLAVRPQLLAENATKLCAVCAAGAGLTALAAVSLLASRPIDPQRILVEPVSFFFGLLGYYVAVTVPFFLAGIAVSAPIARYSAQVNRLYAADLLGAGIGCVAAVGALTYGDAPAALALCASIFVAAGACYILPDRLGLGLGGIAVIIGVCAPVANQVIDFQPTPSKQAAKTLSVSGSETIFTRWSPINRVDVMTLGNPHLTWWGAFGKGVNSTAALPAGHAIQYDGDNGSTIYEIIDQDSMAILDDHLLRAPYLLRESPEVMVIGVGGGVDVMNALRRGASHITGVELQPITIDLLKGEFADWTDRQFLRPDVDLVAAEGRHFVRSSDKQYDIIQITAIDTFSAQSTGAYVLAESYLYTVEAIEDYLTHLGEDGVVSVILGDIRTSDETMPWPLVTRLSFIARQALENRGVANPTDHLMVISTDIDALATPRFDEQNLEDAVGSAMTNLLVKRTPFKPEEIERYQTFATENGFQIRLLPGDTTEAPMAKLMNTYGDELTQALAPGDFALEPLTDDQPFFYHVLRWKAILTGGETFWIFPGSTTGLLMLLIMLVQALLLGGALVMLPLIRGARGNLSNKRTLGFLLYFMSLGLGFFFVEISFVQKYVLLLGYPTYSLSVTIFSLLVFAAFGAWLSRWGWGKPRMFILGLLTATVFLMGIEVFLLPLVRERFLASPLSVRILVTIFLQFPIATCLGMYFPTGIACLRQSETRLVPWAWAVNGVASVVSSVLAVIIAMQIGFSGVMVVAACTYLVGVGALFVVLSDSKGSLRA